MMHNIIVTAIVNCYSHACSQLHMSHSGIQTQTLSSNSEELSFAFYMFDFADRHVEKENLADFISKKREMFLVQVWIVNIWW